MSAHQSDLSRLFRRQTRQPVHRSRCCDSRLPLLCAPDTGRSAGNRLRALAMTQTAADVQARFYSVSCAGSGSSSITRFESSFFGLFTRLLTRCARISSDGYGTTEICRLLRGTGQPGIHGFRRQDQRHPLLRVVNAASSSFAGIVMIGQDSTSSPDSVLERSHSAAIENTSPSPAGWM